MNIDNIRAGMMRILLFLGMAVFVLPSCTSEEEVFPVGGSENTPVAKVRFSLALPSRMQTRAPGEADENAIEAVRVLMFGETGGTATYCFGVNGSNIRTVSTSEKTFEATLPAGRYDMVFLANAQDIVDGSGIAFGDGKEDVLGALAGTNTGKWNGRPVPMWGRLDGVTVSAETGLDGAGAVEMVRMLARVDVEVSATVAPDFVLSSVRLYNYSTRGALVPDLRVWPANNLAAAPTRPSGADGYGAVRGPLVFDAADGVTATGCRQVIYTFEAPAGSAATPSDNICLVVGGSYRGAATGYYRVDIAGSEDGRPVYAPLLRNSHSLIRIVRVSGSGRPSPSEALDSPPVNMNTQLQQWTEKDMTCVVFDGRYTLGLSAGSLTLPADAHAAAGEDNRLTLKTTVPEGWTLEKIADAGGAAGSAPWLALNRTAGAAGAAENIYAYTEANTSQSVRTGYIHIRAGNLRYRVEVTQGATPGFGIEVTDPSNGQPVEMLDFGYGSGEVKTFRVAWKPSTARMTVYVTESGGGFSGAGIPGGTAVLAGSPVTYTVESAPVTADRYTRLDFTLTDGSRTAVRTVFVRQKQ
jgi:hypothetical protein